MKKITIILLLIFVFSFAYAEENSVTSSECLNLTMNLRQGMRDLASTDVSSLQSFLKSNKYLTVNATGYFGLQTLKAVKDFQKSNNINPTGFVGPVTRAMIQKMSCVTVTNTSNNQETATITTNNTTSTTNTNTTPTTPTIVENVPATPPVVSEELLPSPTTSSLRVRTDGVITTLKDSILVKGTVTAGARSGTESWFELTTNPNVYKVSESTVSIKAAQRANDKFEYLFKGLKPATTYYFRACAGNTSLGQKSCGSTTSSITSNI